MSNDIRIIDLPDGPQPLEVLSQFIGITTHYIAENEKGYLVTAIDMVSALLDAGKDKAAECFGFNYDGIFCFPREICIPV